MKTRVFIFVFLGSEPEPRPKPRLQPTAPVNEATEPDSFPAWTWFISNPQPEAQNPQ